MSVGLKPSQLSSRPTYLQSAVPATRLCEAHLFFLPLLPGHCHSFFRPPPRCHFPRKPPALLGISSVSKEGRRESSKDSKQPVFRSVNVEHSRMESLALCSALGRSVKLKGLFLLGPKAFMTVSYGLHFLRKCSPEKVQLCTVAVLLHCGVAVFHQKQGRRHLRLVCAARGQKEEHTCLGRSKGWKRHPSSPGGPQARAPERPQGLSSVCPRPGKQHPRNFC